MAPEKSAVIIRDDSEYDYWLMVYRPDTIQGYLEPVHQCGRSL